MNIEVRHLPANCHSSHRLESVDGAVIHFISDRFQHPETPFDFELIFAMLSSLRLSYHVAIPREGPPIELVDLNFQAWHAGYSILNGREMCNHFTHGVALVGRPGVAYTDSQIAYLGEWLAHDMAQHGYTTDNIAGHDEVRSAWNAAHPEKPAEQKHDPGDLFPWKQIRDMLSGVDMANRLKRGEG